MGVTDGDMDHEPRSFDPAHAIFERLMRVYNDRDVAMIATVYNEDVEYRDDAWPEVVRGHAGVQRLFSALWQMSEDCRFDLIDGPNLSEDGSCAAVMWRVSGTMSGPWRPPRSPAFAPTGSRFSSEIGGFYELKRDRIMRGRVIANQLDMGIQFGAVPPPGSRGEWVGALMQRLTARRMRRRGDVQKRASGSAPGVKAQCPDSVR